MLFLVYLFVLINYGCCRTVTKTDLDYWGIQHVTIDDENKLLETYGYANAKWNIPHNKRSGFAIGSHTKLFAAVAIYQLDEQGIINVSKSISQYLDVNDLFALGYDFSVQPDGIDNNTYCPRILNNDECEEITFIDLLWMNSGLINALNCPFKQDNIYRQFCMDECNVLFQPYTGNITHYIELFINLPLKYKPGIYNDTMYDYSNINYLFIQYFIEKYSGMSFADYIETFITKPLKLKNTYFDPFDGGLGIKRNRVDGWFRIIPKNNNKPYQIAKCRDWEMGAIGAAGGIISSNKDMHKWYYSLFNKHSKPIIFKSNNTIKRILTPYSVTGSGSYFGPGIITRYNYMDNQREEWPELIAFSGSTFCSFTTMIATYDDNDNMLTVSTFDNAPGLYIKSIAGYDNKTNDSIIINGEYYGICSVKQLDGYQVYSYAETKTFELFAVWSLF